MKTSSALRAQSTSVSVRLAFEARCEAKAMLAKTCEIELIETVDRLQFAALKTGLIDEIGQDEVQRMMFEAFK